MVPAKTDVQQRVLEIGNWELSFEDWTLDVGYKVQSRNPWFPIENPALKLRSASYLSRLTETRIHMGEYMPRFVLSCFFVIVFFSPAAYGEGTESSSESQPRERCLNYPDFGFAPAGIQRPLFRLSQTYPQDPPDPENLPPFFPVDLSGDDSVEYFRANWREYLLDVRDYCFEGNLETDWRVENNQLRSWYHMPWQHWGRLGREGLRGLTKEAAIKPKQLAATQTAGGQTYAIAFYNDIAAYLIGQIWKDPDEPDVEAIKRLDGFANGAVIFKLLFADIPLDQVPFLKNPISWEAYITQSFGSDDRSIRLVHLIQMDVMVKDDRAPSGWLYGTFQYNGALNKDDPWENLIPVGLQWGNDPEVTDNEYTNLLPTETKINPKIKESIINPDTTELPPTHLGWNGRLNGPVDNPRSSCMSCHMAAQHPYDGHRISPLFMLGDPIPPGSPAWMLWFANLHCMTPFDEGRIATDSSLQLAMSLQNFYEWKTNRGGGWAHQPPVKCHPDREEGESR